VILNKILLKITFWLFTLLFSLKASAQSSANQFEYNNRQQIIDSVISIGEKFLGKPYKYKAPNINMLDCSGFINQIFKPFEPNLPRSSSLISKQVDKIDFNDVMPGDLLFFKGRNIRNNSIGHVSMVVSKDTSGNIKMMHSCNRGVIIDDYPMSYYKQRFLFAGRIPFIDTIKITPEEKPNSFTFSETDTTFVDTIKPLKIMAVGDLMIGTNFPSDAYLPPKDGSDILKPIHNYLDSSNLAIGNLEGVLLTGEGDVKKCNDPSKCYAFKSPDHYVHHYKSAGFDILSLANNHVGDFGSAGKKNTVQLLKENEIFFAGLEDYPFTTLVKDSIRYGFCAFSPNRGTMRINNYEVAREIVQHLDSICDIVIVSFHGGAEGAKYNHITRKTEMFLGENRGNPYDFSRMVIDAGADLVFGHGPHVVRAVDLYKDRFIAYSLGNFATYARFNLRGPNGLAPLLEVSVNQKGEFIKAKIHSFKQIGEGGPQWDETNSAYSEIKRLTLIDIPEAPLSFDGINTILPKP
jgi:hypothetical protein